MTSTVAGPLISEKLFERLVDRIAAREGVSHEFAARVMNEALVFLRACAVRPDLRLAPSSLVDAGWHAFVLHTKEYAEFCRRVAGQFIHHVPEDCQEMSGPAGRRADLERTMRTITALGLPVDPELWPLRDTTCSNGDDGCRASGKDATRTRTRTADDRAGK